LTVRRGGWRASAAFSGKHMEDAEPVRPGKLVDGAEPVRVACQYTSSPEISIYLLCKSREPILLSKIESFKNRSYFRDDFKKFKYGRGP
jgi:hypothetical protein